MSYEMFARYYDGLMRDVPYAKRADYLCRALKRCRHAPGVCLDLACGTGSLTLELADRGLDIFGLDLSPEMLSVARQKAEARGRDLLLVCQDMRRLNLYGLVDTVFCTMDGINHLPGESAVRQTFRRVASFLNPGGCFLFDANTVYKHRCVLAGHTFADETEEVYCVWQNAYREAGHRVAVTLDFFEKSGEAYRRSTEQFFEFAYEIKAMEEMLAEAGLQTVGIWKDMSFQKPDSETERVLFAARKTDAQ